MSEKRVPSQQQHWDGMYRQQLAAKGKVVHRETEPSDFAQFCAPLLPPSAAILELGCGAGEDAVWFARQGHRVTATDFSPFVVGRNQQSFPDVANLEFRVLNTTSAFPFSDAGFDAVYAHLSLHYFPRDVTITIFQEIRRVLKPGDRLFFFCKSTKEPAYGLGEELEPDLFLQDGKVRRFFSEPFARDCLAEGFKLEHLEPGWSDVNRRGQEAAWIRCVAKAI